MMKKYITLLLVIMTYAIDAQTFVENPHQHNPVSYRDGQASVSNDTTFDVSFYQLNLEIGIDAPYIHGTVDYKITALKDDFNSLILDLDAAYEIVATSDNISTFAFENSQIHLQLSDSYNLGDMVEFSITYQGVPLLENGVKGLRYEMHDNNEPIIASLSTPYLAHNWWPCKDGTLDKADSIAVNITIPDTIIAGIPLIALSNGTLQNTSINAGKKTFYWTHNYPIVPYYVMVAISNYVIFEQNYESEEQSFPLRYYVFESQLEASQNGVADMPEVMAFFSDIFGPYPFEEDGYSMTQLGYYGGIENQTNSIVRQMNTAWLYVSVHELAHQWFADMITCQTWNHSWINEGLASYAEALYFEHAGGEQAYHNYIAQDEFYDADIIYSDDVSDPFNVFRAVIYRKGSYLLHMLRKVVGDDHFFAALKSFATSPDFMYGHATTQDFQQIFEQVSGQSLAYFFEQWVYESGFPIYHYNFTQSADMLHINIEQKQAIQGFYDLFKMPLDIRITYADGSSEIINVFNHQPLQTFNYPLSQEVVEIEIDPDQWVLKNIQYDETVQTTEIATPHSPFVLSPNPTQSDIYIEWVGTQNKPQEIILSNAKGQFFSPQIQLDAQKAHIKMKNLPAGVYFLRIRTQKSEFSHKIVKY